MRNYPLTKEQALDEMLEFARLVARDEVQDAIRFNNLVSEIYHGYEANRGLALWNWYQQKLLTDNMIEMRPDNTFKATFDGYFFEGYEKKSIRLAANNEASARYERTVLSLNRQLNRATWIAALVVVVSLLWDVYKFQHPKAGEGETTIKQTGIFF